MLTAEGINQMIRKDCSFLTAPNPVVDIGKLKGWVLLTVLAGDDDVGILKLVIFNDVAVSVTKGGIVVLGLGKVTDDAKRFVFDIVVVVATAVVDGGVGRIESAGMLVGAILFVLLVVLLLLDGAGAGASGPFFSNKRSKSW
jgi:hypothetical protein